MRTTKPRDSGTSPAVILGHVRLLAGMVRANRPWRFTAKLYGVLAAALAAGAYGIVASDIWRISAALGWWRLAALCLVSLTVTIVAVIVAHELWERSPDPRVSRSGAPLQRHDRAHRHDRDRLALRRAAHPHPRRCGARHRSDRYSLKRSAATARRATTSPSPGSRRPSAPSPAHSAPHSNQTPPSGKPPTGQPARERKSRREPDRGYLTSVSILNIGRYIAMMMIPTTTPTAIIISGSMIDVRDEIDASTSSS